jgi:hypothetical protein
VIFDLDGLGGATFMSDDEELAAAVVAAAAHYDADIFLYSATIDHSGFGKLVGCFPSDRRNNAVLILTTNGGLANSAYQIARFFQNHYKTFSVFIPAFCKSAGTMVALGAHRLIMGPFSELGPLDVQLYERDEIGARKSGLLSHSAFEALKREAFELYEHVLLSIKQRSSDNISFSLASDVSSEMASRLLAPIYEQISPNVLGSDYRDLRVAIEYGRRLAAVSSNIEMQSIVWLTEHYPSHDFIIDKSEAEQLFNVVDSPDGSLFELIRHIPDYVFVEREEGAVIWLNEAIKVPEDGENEDASEETISPEKGGMAGSSRAVRKRPSRKKRPGETVGADQA